MMRFFKTPLLFRILYPKRIWGFNSSDFVYLTFDDGPTHVTEWILDLLKERNITATFFCVGSNVIKRPETYHRILNEGHSVGNHTMNHEKGWKTSNQEYLKSINKAKAQIQSDLFRPPYGKMSKSSEKELRNDYRIVMWSWLSYDFDGTISIEKILKKANKQIRPGDIVVLHDNEKGKERIEILLPELLDLLQKKGYRFSSISS